MFDLNQKSCTLGYVNGRHEKHGEDDVLACDLKFKADKIIRAYLSSN